MTGLCGSDTYANGSICSGVEASSEYGPSTVKVG